LRHRDTSRNLVGEGDISLRPITDVLFDIVNLFHGPPLLSGGGASVRASKSAVLGHYSGHRTPGGCTQKESGAKKSAFPGTAGRAGVREYRNKPGHNGHPHRETSGWTGKPRQRHIAYLGSFW